MREQHRNDLEEERLKMKIENSKSCSREKDQVSKLAQELAGVERLKLDLVGKLQTSEQQKN